MPEAVKQNLAGLRVLDITQYIAGPTLGRILTGLRRGCREAGDAPGGRVLAQGQRPSAGRGSGAQLHLL